MVFRGPCQSLPSRGCPSRPGTVHAFPVPLRAVNTHEGGEVHIEIPGMVTDPSDHPVMEAFLFHTWSVWERCQAPLGQGKQHGRTMEHINSQPLTLLKCTNTKNKLLSSLAALLIIRIYEVLIGSIWGAGILWASGTSRGSHDAEGQQSHEIQDHLHPESKCNTSTMPEPEPTPFPQTCHVRYHSGEPPPSK